MYKGYNLIVDEDFKRILNNYDTGYIANDQNQFSLKLESKIISNEGYLDAQQIEGDWFPEVKADVFISHSHYDLDLAKKFAKYLNVKFNLQVFIDAASWEYVDKLLNKIDKKYCKKEDGYYDYEKRNISTAHVHNILSIALAKMIDKTECIIFLNTQNSTSINVEIKNEVITNSPWIYNELMLTQLIEKKEPVRCLEKRAAVFDSMNENLRINYKTSVGHLIELTSDDILRWEKICELKQKHSLDQLYSMKRNLIEYN